MQKFRDMNVHKMYEDIITDQKIQLARLFNFCMMEIKTFKWI